MPGGERKGLPPPKGHARHHLVLVFRGLANPIATRRVVQRENWEEGQLNMAKPKGFSYRSRLADSPRSRHSNRLYRVA